MDYPKNRLIVNGVDLTEKFKMVLSDGYTLAPPSPKTYIVDIPGGNGKLDLTESLIGDTVYDNRTQEFTFYLINVDNFEKVKTEVSNFLHGRAFDYKLTMDADYTYHGRFSVTSYAHAGMNNGIVGTIVISIDANPFKYKETQTHKIDAVGGKTVYLPSGRMRVTPIVIASIPVRIIHKGEVIDLPAGTWVVDNVTFNGGENEVYLRTKEVHNLLWRDLQAYTWKEFGATRLYEWYTSKGKNVTYSANTWGDLESYTWGELNTLVGNTWAEVEGEYADVASVDSIYISYEWGDL